MRPCNVRRSDVRAAYLRTHRHEWIAAILFGIAGPILFIPGVHEDSAIAEVLPFWLEFTAFAIYALGGLCALAGMWFLRPQLESIGFGLLAGFWAVDTIAIYGVRSVGGALVTSATIYATLVCALRFWALIHRYGR